MMPVAVRVHNLIERRRAKCLAMLGGQCANCGATSALEFHHLNPANKVADVAKMWCRKWSVLEREVRKCRLLCHTCHFEWTNYGEFITHPPAVSQEVLSSTLEIAL